MRGDSTQSIVKQLILLFAIISFPGLWLQDMARASDDKLTFGANIRFRYEFQDNFNQQYYGEAAAKGSVSDGFLLGRFRMGLDYTPCTKIHLALWMQNAQAWDMALSDSDFYSSKFGMEQNPNKDRWELWDTYLELKGLFDVPFFIKGGRQRIFYGNKRVFGPGQWGNSGRWVWDAVKFSYRFQGGFVDGYCGKTQLHDPNEFSLNHRHGFESAGFYSQFNLLKGYFPVVLEPFAMTRKDDHDRYKGEDQSVGSVDSYFYGLRAWGKKIKGFRYDVTYIAQAGDFSNDDIDAYGYHLLLAYCFNNVRMAPKVSIEYSFASGDSDPEDGDHETFDGAFGARDKMYGRMNLFHWKNLKDAQINLEIKPCKRVFLTLGIHKFRLAEKKDGWYLNAKAYRDKTGASGDEVGRELDIVATIDLTRNNRLDLGFGYFRPDEFVKAMDSVKPANCLFLQYSYNSDFRII